ncbi:MAG: dihydrolipoyl dehydrogenase [Buchnera aphidicola (Eriosoma harunire)]
MNKEIRTQVVIIGSGPAGYTAAFRCADLGFDTILIEKYSVLGGVCLNVGCIPSKALLHISQVMYDVKNLSMSGINFSEPVIDINKIRTWKNNIIQDLNNSLFSMSKYRKITVLIGEGVFNTEHSIVVSCDDGITTVHFDHAVIATGSIPIGLPGIAVDHKKIWNSTDALNLLHVPSRLLIIGSGIIGLEMATFYSSLGSHIDIVDNSKLLLPTLDRDIIEVFKNHTINQYNIIMDRMVTKVETINDEFLVTLQDSSGDKYTMIYDNILIAIGRKPAVDGLGLSDIGIELRSSGFINVNNQLKTNIDHIYAIGDVVGYPMLAHKAIYQASVVSEVIAGKKDCFNPRVIPSIAYTIPEIAWVGLSEQEAISLDIDYGCSSYPWKASGKALASNHFNGITKLLFNKKTNRIIGGSIVGVHAGELLGEIGLAIEMGCDVEDISLTIHAHPTLYETIGGAAKMFQGTITDLPNKIKNK